MTGAQRVNDAERGPDDIDFRAVFRTSPTPLLLLSPTLEILDATEAYLDATLTRRQDLVGQHLFAAFPDNPDDAAADGTKNLRASLDHVLATGRPDRMPLQQYDIRRPDGTFEQRYWSPLNLPVAVSGGVIRYLIHQVEDVTAREQAIRETGLRATQLRSTQARLQATQAQGERAEAALLAAETRLGATGRAGEIGTWLWDIPADRVVADPNLARLFGISPEEAASAPIARYVAAVHPADRERVQQSITASLASGGVYEAEYRLIQSDGSVRTVLARGEVERDASGTPIGLPGVVLDITERKALEEALFVEKERAQVTLHSIGDAVISTDVAGRLTYLNPVAERLVGWSQAEQWIVPCSKSSTLSMPPRGCRPTIRARSPSPGRRLSISARTVF